MSQAPLPLNYQNAAERPRSIAWGWHILTTASVSLALLLISIINLFVPAFEAIFKDFKTELPAITKLVLVFSRWFANDFGIAYLLLAAAAVVGVGFVLDARASSRSPIREYAIWTLIVSLLLLALYGVLVVVSLAAPLISICASVSGSTAKK